MRRQDGGYALSVLLWRRQQAKRATASPHGGKSGGGRPGYSGQLGITHGQKPYARWLPRIAVSSGLICDRTAVSPVKFCIRLDIVAARPNALQFSMSRCQYFSIAPARIKKSFDRNTRIWRRRTEGPNMRTFLKGALMAAPRCSSRRQCQSQCYCE